MTDDRYHPDELHALAELGYALVREGKLEDARGIWEGLATVSPTQEAPFRALAVIALYEKRWEDGVALATAALGRRPSAAALLIRAEACVHTQRGTEALRDLEQILGVEPRDDEDTIIARRARVLYARLGRSGATTSSRRA